MKDIAIYGAGGFGKEVACLIGRINKAEGCPKWRLVGFFDDAKPSGSKVSHFGTVLGGMDKLNAWPTPIDVAIAIGAPQAIKDISNRIINPHVAFPNLIDPSFELFDPETITMGRGNVVVGPGSLSCDVRLGDFNVLVGGVVVGHDVCIGSYNVLMPGARVSGKVVMGNLNLLGANAIVLQGLRIGYCVTVAMGSALMTNPTDGSTYLGVPAIEYNPPSNK